MEAKIHVNTKRKDIKGWRGKIRRKGVKEGRQEI